MSNGIAFRRINGRVIPIRVPGNGNQDRARQTSGPHESYSQMAKRKTEEFRRKLSPKNQTRVGAGLIASGLGIAVAAGNKADHLLRNSARAENLSRFRPVANKLGQLPLFNVKRTERLARYSAKAFRARHIALLGGALAGGALIEAGRQVLDPSRKVSSVNLASSVGGAGAVSNLTYRRRIFPGETVKEAIRYAKKRTSLDYLLKGM